MTGSLLLDNYINSTKNYRDNSVKRVAHLTPTFNRWSGIDRVVENIAIHQVNNGWDVSIFTLQGNLKPEKIFLKTLGCPNNIILQRIYRLIFFLDLPKIFKLIFSLRRYDVIIVHQYPMTIASFLAKKFFKNIYIFYCYGGWSGMFSSFSEKMYMSILRLGTILTIRNADLVVSISNHVRKELMEYMGIESVVVYEKIDTSRYHSGVNGSKVLRKYNFEGKFILFIGRLVPYKGIKILIEAHKIVRKYFPEMFLIIAGRPTFPKYLKNLKKQADEKVKFLGEISEEDKVMLYNVCTVYVSASLWEGSGTTLAEAQACGAPIVAFDLEANMEFTEILRESGLNIKPDVKFVEKGDLTKLAETIIKTILEREHKKINR